MSVQIKFPPLSYYFSVEILGAQTSLEEAGFQSVKGLSASMGTETIVEGGENRLVHTVPTVMKYTPLELTRGLIVANSPFGNWCRDHLSGGMNSKVALKDLIVHLMDAGTRMPIMSWAFARAYPTKWNVSSLEAQKTEIVVETLEITYAYFTVL